MPPEDHYRYGSAAECEICSQLREHEGGCAKAADDALFLPPVASRLVSVPGSWMNALEKCPLCGTYYSYSHFLEYSPSGNDEEAHLRRLPAAEALAILIDDRLYAELEDWARRGAPYAKMVLVAINQSTLKRDTVEFQALHSICKATLAQAGSASTPVADAAFHVVGPIPMDSCRAWLATFDSYNPRTNDLYYIMTVLDRGVPTARFVTAVFPYWDPEAWNDPVHIPKLCAALQQAAIEGRTNTAYQGTHVAWHTAGGRLTAAEEQ